MGKVKEFLGNLLTIKNFVIGLCGLWVGVGVNLLYSTIQRYTFQDIAIFIGVGIVFILVIFLLGFLLNKILFKNDY